MVGRKLLCQIGISVIETGRWRRVGQLARLSPATVVGSTPMQTAIPCLFMRGGTSRGPFFQASDLPADVPTRDRVLLSVMGSPDKRQIDGLGGAHPLTSKVGIVTKGSTPGVDLNFLDTAGSVAPGLLPTGKVRDLIDGIEVTCIDNGMPLVMFKATDVGRTGYESVEQLNADSELKTRIERLRIACGHAMKLGDVTGKNYPKMTLIAAPRTGGSICTRSFIPHVCHEAIGVLAAVTVATACVLDGSITQGVASVPVGNMKKVSVEHPTGEFSVEIEVDPANQQNVTRAALLRTARLLMRGEVMVPGSVWAPQPEIPSRQKRETEKT